MPCFCQDGLCMVTLCLYYIILYIYICYILIYSWMYTELETAIKMKQQQILHVNAIWFPCEDRSTNKQLTGNSALVRTTSWSCCLETYGGTPFCSSESRIECSLIQYPARSSPTLATLQTSTHLLYLKLVLIFMCIYIYNQLYNIILVGGLNPLKNMSSSVGVTLPNIWKNTIHVPNHQPDHHHIPTVVGL